MKRPTGRRRGRGGRKPSIKREGPSVVNLRERDEGRVVALCWCASRFVMCVKYKSTDLRPKTYRAVLLTIVDIPRLSSSLLPSLSESQLSSSSSSSSSSSPSPSPSSKRVRGMNPTMCRKNKCSFSRPNTAWSRELVGAEWSVG